MRGYLCLPFAVAGWWALLVVHGQPATWFGWTWAVGGSVLLLALFVGCALDDLRARRVDRIIERLSDYGY